MENYGGEENFGDFCFKRFNESNEDVVEFENSSQSEFDRGNMENYGAEENCVDFFFKRFNESNEDEVEFENSSQSEFDKWYALEDLFSSFSWGFHLSGDSPGCSDGFLNVGSEETGTDILKAVSCYEQGDRLLVGRISSCNQSAFGLNISSSNQCSNDLLDASKAAPPHAALFFTLGYLPWQELLMIQRVCRSLRDAVNEDLLLWQDICVEPPMSSKLTNEKLLKLTAKAQGSLRSLTLMECSQITDAGLQQIINNNPHIVKIQRLSFDDQISCFEKTKEVMKANIGEDDAEKLCNEAVYFIGLGSNDFVNNFLQPFLADAQQYTPDEFQDLLISTLELQLTRLHELGARKVVFHGLGPLGCIPSQRVKSKNGECLKRVNEWCLQFNSNVQKLLHTLNSKLPAALLTFADTYPIVLDLIDNPQTYGFRISNTSCCNVDTTVGGLCLPNSKLCSDRKEYVFWDAFHPTDAANVVIADRLFSDPRLQVAPAPAPAPARHQLAPSPAPVSRRQLAPRSATKSPST